MAREKGEGTVSKRKDGSWIAQFDLGKITDKRKQRKLVKGTSKL